MAWPAWQSGLQVVRGRSERWDTYMGGLRGKELELRVGLRIQQRATCLFFFKLMFDCLFYFSLHSLYVFLGFFVIHQIQSNGC